MKLETAKLLNWPWECEKYFVLVAGKYEVHDRETTLSCFDPTSRIPRPSVEEMLERMPALLMEMYSLTVVKHPHRFTVSYHLSCGNRSLDQVFHDADLSEALALLCIWLKDNGLMELKDAKP